VAAAVALAGQHPDQSRTAIAALAFYIALYLFMNLGAFSGVAFLRNVIHSEAIDDYAGLIHKSPGLALCLSVILFSLVGLPPLAGFMGKFTIFAVLFDARLLTVLAIGGLNTVLSLFYYLRVVKIMTLSAEPALRPAPVIAMASAPGLYCLMVTAPVVILGVWWNGLFTWAQAAATSFLG
jgi:NADH-quinone oxidoreductase subunit N